MPTLTRAPVYERGEPLTAEHRCDSCGAHASVSVVMLIDGERKPVLLCRHDYGRCEDKVATQAEHIILFPIREED